MFLISFSAFSVIFSESSLLSPRNWRWGMRIRSFFFLVSASLFHLNASGFSCGSSFAAEPLFLPFLLPVAAF